MASHARKNQARRLQPDLLGNVKQVYYARIEAEQVAMAFDLPQFEMPEVKHFTCPPVLGGGQYIELAVMPA